MFTIFSSIWFTFLYQPTFNALIWIYTNIAGQNLGWAVVWLTVFLRILLLPLSIISERNSLRRQKADLEASQAVTAFKNDVVAQRDAVRKVMRKYRMSPWAKMLSLAIQALVLVLLYQVFIRGITGDRIVKILYPFIDFPGKIDTNFYGFEVGERHSSIWAGIAALYLLVSIVIETRERKKWEKSEMYFLLFFPLFTFAALWYLPMVKSLFILTTMIFSDILSSIIWLGQKMFKSAPKPAH